MNVKARKTKFALAVWMISNGISVVQVNPFDDLIYRLSSGMHLKFVDYYHTHKVLLWDKIPEKIKAKLTKAQLFGKKIVLTNIYADGTPEIMFF